MNRIRIVSCLIFLMCAFVITARGQMDPNRQRAEMLWEEAIKAKGGHERLQSVESFLISSTIDVRAPRGGGETKTERLYAMPGKAWLYEFTEHFDVSLEATVINKDLDLCTVTLAPVGPMHSVPGLTVCLPTVWSQRLIQDPVIYLMETKWVRPVPLRSRTEGKGKKQRDVIETEVGQLRVDFYLDPRTHLPVKLMTDEFGGLPGLTRQMGMMVTFENYVDVNGIQMPRVVVREPQPLNTDAIRRDTERAKYQFNVAYDETIFNRPISKKAKAEDWKGPKK